MGTLTPAAQALLDHAERVRDLVMIKDCRDCGDPIFWVKTHYGKNLPIDVERIDMSANDIIIDQHGQVYVTPLVPRHRCEPFQTYRTVAAVLRDHPDLEPLWQQFRDGPMGLTYDPIKHDHAKAAWADALKQRRIRMVFADSMVGFGADRTTPDPATYSDGTDRGHGSSLLGGGI